MASGKLPTLFTARKNWALLTLLVSLAILSMASAVLVNAATAKSLHPDYQLLRGEVQHYGDWLVGCDNEAECTIIGFPRQLVRTNTRLTDMAIEIRLTGAIGAPQHAEIFPFGSGSSSVLETAAPSFHLATGPTNQHSEMQYGFFRYILSEAESASVIAALLAQRNIIGIDTTTNQAIARFPFDDFARAYRAALARRFALLQRLSESPIPAGSELPLRGSASPIIVSGFAPILASNNCGDNVSQNMHRYRFTSGAELWRYTCANAASQSLSYWAMSPHDSLLAAPLELPEPRDNKVMAGTNGLENAVFDFDFGILRSYNYQDGHTDCGEFRAWANTNQGWQLIERREMPLCKGLEPNQWIRTYFKPTSGAGQDE